MKVFLNLQFILFMVLNPPMVAAQNPAGKCPPGWERNPGKHPDCSFSLPVTVKSFKAVVVGQTVVLGWEVAEEINHSHYVVQKSKDGKRWEDFGNTFGYEFTDYHPEQSNYYRLVSVDIDQTRHFYKIVFTRFEPVWLSIYTTEGKHLGEFRSLQDAPRNKVIIINQTKTLIQ